MDKIDIDKIKTVPVDLYELSHVVENNIVKKKTVYDKLVAKFNAIDISGFVLKMHYNTDKPGLEKKVQALTKST